MAGTLRSENYKNYEIVVELENNTLTNKWIYVLMLVNKKQMPYVLTHYSQPDTKKYNSREDAEDDAIKYGKVIIDKIDKL